MGIHQELGLRTAVNASGRMTALGGSTLSDGAVAAMGEAARSYVVMDDLLRASGRAIADAVGAPDACPTTGAAAGVAVSVAAVVAGSDPARVEALPDAQGRPDEVVLPKGHAVHFGAPVVQMVALGGGRPVEAGAANRVHRSHLAGAVGARTAALLYVQSHHAVQKGMVALEDVLAVGAEHGVPVIVDAAAEEDLRRWAGCGADLVVFSGGKAIGGPASGFVCGRADLVAACRAQYAGIARPMKVGKETVAGLVRAVREYTAGGGGVPGAEQRRRMGALAERLDALPGITASVRSDEAGRDIHRAVLAVDRDAAGRSAVELAAELAAGDPPVHLRDHEAGLGRLAIDPRPLAEGEDELIAARIAALVGGGAGGRAGAGAGAAEVPAPGADRETAGGTVRRTLTVTEAAGLHARPAARFAQAAARCAAEVTVRRADRAETVAASSVLALLTLNVRAGDRIVLSAAGPDAAAALDALAAIAAPGAPAS